MPVRVLMGIPFPTARAQLMLGILFPNDGRARLMMGIPFPTAHVLLMGMLGKIMLVPMLLGIMTVPT